MTAEVAILNKLGVALAADSAVTISQGSSSRKVFNTADKLFELSSVQPIACMIFSGMQFMQAPLPVLIKDFRSSAPQFDTIEQASTSLLNYLSEYAQSSNDIMQQAAVHRSATSVLTMLTTRVSQLLMRRLSDMQKPSADLDDAEAKRNPLETLWEQALGAIERIASSWPDSNFIGAYPATRKLNSIIRRAVSEQSLQPPETIVERIVALVRLSLKKNNPAAPSTGIVVAGFGRTEIFPTLVHLKVYEPVLGALKFDRVEGVDIARSGPRARVMAFAQREMAERFLFGLDLQVKDKMLRFCRQTVTKIGESTTSLLEFESVEEKDEFKKSILSAELAFVRDFEELGMETIRRESQKAVEDMVEFMPKQDLAEFAEALVNLSSLQRRVASGFETVGGPIDVAVISKAEGLVWVKRKHYFPTDLNSRYFNRLKETRDE